jgi:hypothetical protein
VGGGWVKREARAVRGTDEDADGDASATCGVGIRTACGVGWGTGATRGMVTISEVPTTEEG